MIPMTPSSPACYQEVDGVGEEGSYWPSGGVSPGVAQSVSGDEGTGGAKVRKPYTITKQRERWTEEEHQKFLEALKLYGRAWRRIEEHIGTKTAVQIRSHAQKFFSKIERDVTAGLGAETGVAQVIDIPPPRPKRKPTHPYPRKAGRSFGKTNPEDESPLAAAGSISSSSGVSTANVTEGCSKSSAWEQEESAEACHADAAKANTPKPADGGLPSPAPNAGPPLMNHSPVPIPAFPGAMPWARMFGGGINPAAMVNPAMINPAMMNPQGMMMPWGVAPNAQGLENGGAMSAMAATIAAASAWWAMQGGMPPGLMHPALGAMYSGGAAPPLAIPAPFLYPQCTSQEPAAAAVAPCTYGKDVAVVDDGQDIPSCNGSSRSNAMRRKRAERAQRVKELKARRMGSGNHLLSVSSDVCASTSGGSGTNLTAGQVTTANLFSESAVNSLYKGVSLPANLNKMKHALSGHVRKDREAPPGDPADEGDDKTRKRLRGGGLEDCPSPSLQSGGPSSAHMEKVRSISGSNNLSGQFAAVEPAYDEASPTDASCGSDTSDGAGAGQAVGNGSSAGSRRGPSSNSSACGNAAAGTDRSGSSDGSSEGEATCNKITDRQQQRDPDVDTNPDETKLGRAPKQFTFNEFLPACSEKPDALSSRLPRTTSIDNDQRKEVTERGQIAFQALFKRGTLPRTFSPPPRLALGTGGSTKQPSKGSTKQPPTMTRSLSVDAIQCETLTLPSRKDHESAFNTWQHLRGTSSASKADRCDSAVSIPSSSSPSRPSRRSHNWLQLAPTSSLDDADDEERDDGDDEEDEESADSGVDERERFVCKLDLTIVGGSPDGELESLGSDTTSLGPGPGLHGLALCVGLKSKYSGLGFVPYQRACTARVEPPVHKL